MLPRSFFDFVQFADPGQHLFNELRVKIFGLKELPPGVRPAHQMAQSVFPDNGIVSNVPCHP
jgi:hypothetical protein